MPPERDVVGGRKRAVLCGVVVRPLQKWGSHVCDECRKGNTSTFCGPLFKEVFIMQKKALRWQRWVFSDILANKTRSQKIAYVAVMTAFCVVTNMFFEFKFADVQFSLTIFVSALTGILIGPCFGFVACFLGDLVGFLYNSAGFAYLPWIGISMGLTAFVAGLVVNLIEGNGKGWFLYVKLGIVCVTTFLLCTVAINTTAFWLLYSKVDYWTYLVTRLFVQGQIWNSLVNFVLLFLAVPILNGIKPLKINVR